LGNAAIGFAGAETFDLASAVGFLRADLAGALVVAVRVAPFVFLAVLFFAAFFALAAGFLVAFAFLDVFAIVPSRMLVGKNTWTVLKQKIIVF
jgi:hypothetical protein